MGGGSDKGLNVTRGLLDREREPWAKYVDRWRPAGRSPRQTRASFGAQKQHFGFIQQDHEASHGGKPRRPSRTCTWLRGDPGRGEGELSDAVVNQSGPRVADHVELSVAVVEVQRDRSARRCRAAPDLGDVKFDAGGEINPYPVLFTGRGADDGAAKSNSSTAGIETLAVRRSMSIVNSNGLKSGSWTVLDMAWNTHQWVLPRWSRRHEAQ